MRIGSIVYPKDPAKFCFCRVLGQEGTGLKVKTINVPPVAGNYDGGDELVLEVGTFHRLDDKQLEAVVQAAYGIEKGASLPNPNKPVYKPVYTPPPMPDYDAEAEDEDAELCEECDGVLNDLGECPNPNCPSNED